MRGFTRKAQTEEVGARTRAVQCTGRRRPRAGRWTERRAHEEERGARGPHPWAAPMVRAGSHVHPYQFALSFCVIVLRHHFVTVVVARPSLSLLVSLSPAPVGGSTPSSSRTGGVVWKPRPRVHTSSPAGGPRAPDQGGGGEHAQDVWCECVCVWWW